jgi:cell division cycle 20-like protein 1 (cofactor of APC complex)
METDSCPHGTTAICAHPIISETKVAHRPLPRTESSHRSPMLSKVCATATHFWIQLTRYIEQANAIFNSILHTEVTPPSPRRAISPTRPVPIASGSSAVPPSTPTRRRLFAYNSPSASNPGTPTRRLDTPTDEAYSMSPVRAESRQLLESPRRQLRSVCKTPYRVLDAPELADDFYLNLVDWSSTNVLGVGLGSCVYLWTAHNAAVSKLCDLAEHNDTISSVSWVQRVSHFALSCLVS